VQAWGLVFATLHVGSGCEITWLLAQHWFGKLSSFAEGVEREWLAPGKSSVGLPPTDEPTCQGSPGLMLSLP
jgi:hypothetical protein